MLHLSQNGQAKLGAGKTSRQILFEGRGVPVIRRHRRPRRLGAESTLRQAQPKWQTKGRLQIAGMIAVSSWILLQNHPRLGTSLLCDTSTRRRVLSRGSNLESCQAAKDALDPGGPKDDDDAEASSSSCRLFKLLGSLGPRRRQQKLMFSRASRNGLSDGIAGSMPSAWLILCLRDLRDSFRVLAGSSFISCTRQQSTWVAAEATSGTNR